MQAVVEQVQTEGVDRLEQVHDRVRTRQRRAVP